MLFLLTLNLLVLSSPQAVAATSKSCLVSVAGADRVSRIFDPLEVQSKNLYRKYSYAGFETDSRSMTFLTSDSKHAIFEDIKPFKKAIGEAVSVKEVMSNRLNIELVMKDFKLSRAQAVELQALLRRYYPKASNEDFMAVLNAVKKGKSMSGARYEEIKKAKFVVALDVDGTLLDQDYQTKKPVAGVHQYLYSYGGRLHSVAMSPGWENLIRGIKKRGGSVVLFSRNSDELIQSMFESIKIDGIAVADIADAIYSSSHMVIPVDARKLIEDMPIHQIVTKDLRIIDGGKTIIIDDNPEFVHQKSQNRVVTRFSAENIDPTVDVTESSDKDSMPSFLDFGFKFSKKKAAPKKNVVALIQERELELATILEEIDLALNTMKTQKTTFAKAYEPFAIQSYDILNRGEDAE